MKTETYPDLKGMLARPGGVGAFWFALGTPALVELALPSEPDLVVFDLQHGLWRLDTFEAALGALPPHVASLARLADASTAGIGQALDLGATGVLVPLVEDAATAAACVAAAHYPPAGTRSGGGVRPLARGFPAYVAEARTRTVVGVMIETAAGVANAAAIAATPGLDFVFIGTGDLALSLGCFPTVDARHAAACRAIQEACHAANIPCGTFTMNAEEAARRRDEGYALVIAANDTSLVSAGFAAAWTTFTAQKAKEPN